MLHLKQSNGGPLVILQLTNELTQRFFFPDELSSLCWPFSRPSYFRRPLKMKTLASYSEMISKAAKKMITVITEAVDLSRFPYKTSLFAVIALSGRRQCLSLAFVTPPCGQNALYTITTEEEEEEEEEQEQEKEKKASRPKYDY